LEEIEVVGLLWAAICDAFHRPAEGTGKDYRFHLSKFAVLRQHSSGDVTIR